MEPLSGQFGALWGTLGSLWGHFDPSWRQVDPKLTLSWPKMAPSSPKLSPRWLQIGILKHFGSTLGSLWVTLGTLGGHFGVTLGVFRIILDDFGVNLKPFWVHEGYMGSILACFQQALIFPIDFNDFINLRCQLGTTLGSLCSTLGSLWCYLWHLRMTLAYLVRLSVAFWAMLMIRTPILPKMT